MKLLIYPLAMLLAFSFTSCNSTDFSDPPLDNTFGVGAFPKLVNLETDFFDFNDLENSAYVHSVDFVDGWNGQDVSEYRVYLSYEQAGQQETELTLFRTIESSEFILRAETNQVGIDLMIPFAEVAAFLEIDNLQAFSTEDRFNFRTELVKNDGRTFSSINSTPAITNAFGGIWDFGVKAVCPLADDQFVGDYRVSYGYVYDYRFTLFDVLDFPILGNPLDRVVTLEPAIAQGRTLNYGLVFGGADFSSEDVRLSFLCGTLIHSDLIVLAGCGAEYMGTVQLGGAVYDQDDDSTFTVEMIDWPTRLDGDCGRPLESDSLTYSIVFTKI
jgi:hypothetical protein